MSKLSVNTLLIFLISATDSPEETIEPVEVKEEEKVAKAIEIYVWVDKLRLRSASNTSSETVAIMKEGQALTFLNEPWLKVSTADGQEGWVYGGGVKFYKIGVDESPTAYDDCFKLKISRKMTQAKIES